MKKWYQSKVIILNIIATLLLLLPLVDNNLLTILEIENTPKYLTIIATITTALNTVLRIVTKGTLIQTRVRKIKNR